MRTNLTHLAAAMIRGKLCMLAAAISFFPALAWSQEYTVTALGDLGGGISVPTAVNNKGQVAGYSNTDVLSEQIDLITTLPFVYSNGVMNALVANDEFLWNYALAMNDNGTVVGEYFSNSQNQTNAFQWNLGLLNLAPANESFADAINENGVAVGANGYLQGPTVNFTNEPLGGGVPIGVIFNGGNIIDIPTGPFISVSPFAINNSEEIAGLCITKEGAYLGCVVSNGIPQLLQPVPFTSGDVWAFPTSINASGYMCGESYKGTYLAPTATAATYWRNGAASLLGHPPNSINTQCNGMDDYGNGVGDATSKTEGQIGVIYDPVNGARDLNKLIPQLFRKGHAFKIQNAVSLSDTGFIAAQCAYENGNNDACLLTPNPVLILRDVILNLAANSDIVCIPCADELVPEARSLPKSIDGLTADQRERALKTIDSMGSQIESLERRGDLSVPVATLLIHDAELAVEEINPLR